MNSPDVYEERKQDKVATVIQDGPAPEGCLDGRDGVQKRGVRIAVLIASYKRFEYLVRQVHCMLNQTVGVDVFVAVKGMSRFHVEGILRPMFAGAIEKGRLHLDYFANSNQLTNLLDTVRRHDYRQYDLFARVDDDDFYTPRYMEEVQEFHRLIKPGYSSYHDGQAFYFNRQNGVPAFSRRKIQFFSPTMVISRRVLEKLFFIEANPSRIGEACKQVRVLHHNSTAFSFTEDNLIHMIMMEEGCINRKPFVEERGLVNHVMINHENESVTRGNFVPNDFRAANYSLSKSFPEDFVFVRHSGWDGVLRIFKGKAWRVASNERAEVVLFNDRLLTLKWEEGGTESFRVQPDFSYALMK